MGQAGTTPAEQAERLQLSGANRNGSGASVYCATDANGQKTCRNETSDGLSSVSDSDLDDVLRASTNEKKIVTSYLVCSLVICLQYEKPIQEMTLQCCLKRLIPGQTVIKGSIGTAHCSRLQEQKASPTLLCRSVKVASNEVTPTANIAKLKAVNGARSWSITHKRHGR